METSQSIPGQLQNSQVLACCGTGKWPRFQPCEDSRELASASKADSILECSAECGNLRAQKLQKDEYNNSPQGVPLCYLGGHFNNSSLAVSKEDIPKSDKKVDSSSL